MSRKRTFFAVVGIAAVVGVFQTRGRIVSPALPASVADGIGPATFRYWWETGRHFRSCSRSDRPLVELADELRSGKLVSPEQYESLWSRWGTQYEEAAQYARSAITGIERLSTDGIDQIAVDSAAGAGVYLRCREELFRACSEDCRAYAKYYADVVAAGGTIDENTPEGRRLSDREQVIVSTLARRAENEGRKEKAALADFTTTASRQRAELAARYAQPFPDFASP